MKMILHIFRKDMKGLITNIFAFIIAGGLCIIPCLYAWFNIYSNWDPYSNTGSVKIAVASEDQGYVKKDGTKVVMGEDVIEQLQSNENLGWQFPETSKEAIEGVYSGEYYAAIIIGEDFSDKLYNFIDNNMEHPTVTYYENAKKNAIAIKITDTGKGTLQQSINQEFIDVVITMVMDNIASIAAEDGNAIEDVIANLKKLQENLHAYETALQAFQSSNATLAESIESVKDTLPEVEDAINNSVSSVSETTKDIKNKAEDVLSNLNTLFKTMDKSTKSAQNHVKKGLSLLDSNPKKALKEFKKAQNYIKSLKEQNQSLIKALDKLKGIDPKLDHSIESVKSTLHRLNTLENTVFEVLKEAISMFKEADDVSEHLIKIVKNIVQDTLDQIPDIHDTLSGDLKKNLKSLQKSASTYLDTMTESLDNIDIDLSGLDGILGGIKSVMLGMNGTMTNMTGILDSTCERVDEIVAELDSVTKEEKYKKLIAMMTGDSSAYGEFLSSPVQVTTEHVYEVKNYGSAVTPFYTVLALWVGALLLTALIRVDVKKEGRIQHAKLHQLYLGRYLLFFLLGQVQAIITATGNLYILKVQCLEPELFYLTTCFTSFVFTLLIYTLTLSWGDVGKALAVVMVVLQIAGSSGTYPVELLPDFYQKIYLFFPFPYAINAMRETVCGMYEDAYMKYMGVLCIYVAIALVIGLFIRKPFIKINHFMEERMKDTKMM